MENNEFVAGALYDAALIDFAEWRNDPDNLHDVALFDEMLKKINAMGYGSYSSYPDITMRRHDDPNVIDIIADYLGKFDDEGITGELVRSIGTKNGKIATERIIDSFFGLSETSKCNHATFYDTALTNICDKRFADKYVEMIFISTNSDYEQCIGLSLFKFKGAVYINGERVKLGRGEFTGMQFSERTAPQKFNVEIDMKSGVISIYNSARGWREDIINHTPSAVPAMIVDKTGENSYVFHCNDYVYDDDFDDLVFSLEVTKLE